MRRRKKDSRYILKWRKMNNLSSLCQLAIWITSKYVPTGSLSSRAWACDVRVYTRSPPKGLPEPQGHKWSETTLWRRGHANRRCSNTESRKIWLLAMWPWEIGFSGPQFLHLSTERDKKEGSSLKSLQLCNSGILLS